MSRLQVCVECSIVPLGNVTASGVVAICLLITCVSSVRKWPDAPELLRAYALAGLVVWAVLWLTASLLVSLLESASNAKGLLVASVVVGIKGQVVIKQ